MDASVTETRLRPGQDSCLTKVLTPHTNTTMQLSFSLSQLKGFIRYIYETITLKLYISFPLCPRTCLALFLPVFLSVSLPICLSLYLFVPLSSPPRLSVSLSSLFLSFRHPIIILRQSQADTCSVPIGRPCCRGAVCRLNVERICLSGTL